MFFLVLPGMVCVCVREREGEGEGEIFCCFGRGILKMEKVGWASGRGIFTL